MPDIDTILQWFALIGYAVLLGTVFLLVALFRGRQTLGNLIIATTLAWPLWLASRTALEHYNISVHNWGAITLFVAITIATTWLTYRIMPAEFREKTFESISKKLLLTIGATIQVLLVTFHVLSLEALIPGGGGVAPFFSPEHYTVWWMIVVYTALYLAL